MKNTSLMLAAAASMALAIPAYAGGKPPKGGGGDGIEIDVDADSWSKSKAEATAYGGNITIEGDDFGSSFGRALGVGIGDGVGKGVACGVFGACPRGGGGGVKVTTNVQVIVNNGTGPSWGPPYIDKDEAPLPKKRRPRDDSFTD